MYLHTFFDDIITKLSLQALIIANAEEITCKGGPVRNTQMAQ